jgi:hypothetical protein
MTTRFDNLISDFYAVESMFWTLKPSVIRMRFPEFFSIRHDEGQRYPLNILLANFVKDMGKWRKKNHPPMARMLRDSLLGMAFGEARHATAYDRYAGCYELNHELLTSNRSRQSVYDRLGTFAVDDVTVLEELFDCSGWCDSFGGESWAEITRYVQRYGSIDSTTFIDTVVHAVHNGGCAFDKGLMVMVNSTSQVQTILDQKRDGSVLDLHWLRVSQEVHKWILQYKRLCDLLDFPVKIPEELGIHNGIEYDQIIWASKSSLELTHNKDRERQFDEDGYCEGCGEYHDECECDCDCDECKPSYVHNPYNSTTTTTKGISNAKLKKQEQEKAKNNGQDFDYNSAKITSPLPLR